MDANVDRLGVVGALVGAYLVLAGFVNVVGTPWQYSQSSLTVVPVVVGSVATIAVGAALVWLALRVGDARGAARSN